MAFPFSKGWKIGSGTGERRREGVFVPGIGKDPNENTQRATVTKETSGKRT